MPTVPEFMSLLQLDESCSGGGEFINPIFELKGSQSRSRGYGGHSYWTADSLPSDSAWHVNCAVLDIGPLSVRHELFVRVVRYHVVPENSIDLKHEKAM